MNKLKIHIKLYVTTPPQNITPSFSIIDLTKFYLLSLLLLKYLNSYIISPFCFKKTKNLLGVN